MKLLMGLAIAPVILILIYVYRMDKVEREPIGLLLKLLIFGAISCIPASFLEEIGDAILLEHLYDTSLAYLVIENFFVVAVAEELLKLLVLRIFTWKNKNFNFFFDGIVYAVTASLGFALLENILYVVDGGLSVAITRAFLSIPGHASFGICMGIFYAYAKHYSNYGRKSEAAMYSWMALLAPVLMHGFYDYALSTESWMMTILFFVFVIVTDITCIKKISKYSKNDKYIINNFGGNRY